MMPEMSVTEVLKKLIGPTDSDLKMDNLLICGADSTEPDLDDGQMGRYLTGELKRKIFQNSAEQKFSRCITMLYQFRTAAVK